jgi:S-adenosylmethionine decarboxylase
MTNNDNFSVQSLEGELSSVILLLSCDLLNNNCCVDSLVGAHDFENPMDGILLTGDAVSSKSSVTEENDTEEYHGMFEGPEKTLEVSFRPGVGPVDGLRTMDRAKLDFLCTKAKCSIVHQVSNNHQDAYILSESSLFIYKHRFIMKTCGTTTLLRCLAHLLEFADDLGMEMTWVGYSRKNLINPSAQSWPHSNFGEELKYLSTHEKLQNRLRGTGHILGPITGDHWFVYVADHSETSPFRRIPASLPPPQPSSDRTVNMMMFDIDLEVAEIFYVKNTSTAVEMTKKAGIHHLCPGATIDETLFTPCGYSMNSILHDCYSTMHITPEPQCSYASFETNACLENYGPMMRNVLSVFKPKRFVLTMFGDAAVIGSLKCLPTDLTSVPLPGAGVYVRTSTSSTKVDIELCCAMACFSLDSMKLSSSCQSFVTDDHLIPNPNLSPVGESLSSKGGWR